MKLYKLEQKQRLHISLDRAWEFFSDPYKLQQITPPSLQFTITSKPELTLYEGMIITYKLKVFHFIPVTWITEITRIKNKKMFIDEQRFGPYKFWHHEHRFQETKEGVEMYDCVHYALNYGLFGGLIHSLLVRRELESIFSFRKKKLDEKFVD